MAEQAKWTASEAIAWVEARIRSQRLGPAETVEGSWEKIRARLTAEAFDFFAQQGLRDRVTDTLHIGRVVTYAEGVGAVKLTVTSTAVPVTSIFLRVIYSTGQGVKPLGEFTEDDCYAVATDMKQQASGLLNTAAFMEEAAKQLKQAKVTTLNALPKAIRAQLESQWEQKGIDAA